MQQAAQEAVADLVESVGGRFLGQAPIPTGHLDHLARLFDEWARTHAVHEGGDIVFHGRPGFWHALDDLYPLRDPRRWTRLRGHVIRELEASGWGRLAPPRGSAFVLPPKPW